MKINLHILLDVLEPLGFHGTLPDEPSERRCAYPVIFHEFPSSFAEENLYILKNSLFPEEANVPCHASILCIGTPPAEWLDNICNLLYTENSQLSEFDLMNLITAQFYRYQSWEASLQEIISTNQSFQKMALVTAPILNNPIEVWESQIYLICFNIPPVMEETPLYHSFKTEHPWKAGFIMDEENIQNLVTDEEYNQAYTIKKPAIYSGRPHGFRTLYYNIFLKETPIARICLSEIIVPFSTRDFALIQIFGDLLAMGLGRNGVYSFRHQTKFLEVLKGLVEHRLQPENKISQFLSEYSWKMNNEYICLVLRQKIKEKQSTFSFGPLAIELNKLIPNSFHVTHGSHLVFICNLSQSGKSREQLYKQILPFLRDSLLSASISTSFYCFKDLYYYYQQAVIAAEIGEKKDITKWYFKFEDYQTEYLLQQYQEKLHPKVLIPTGLYRLIEYDEKKGTNYAETLRIYLENACSTQKTTQQLFLHRNSLAYRIARIEEILSIDLDSAENRLILQLAFRLLNR